LNTVWLKRPRKGHRHHPGHLFSTGDRYGNFIRLNAANWSEEASPAIRRLGQVIDMMSKAG
jgi:DNA-binding transcriptional MocR family regulator